MAMTTYIFVLLIMKHLLLRKVTLSNYYLSLLLHISRLWLNLLVLSMHFILTALSLVFAVTWIFYAIVSIFFFKIMSSLLFKYILSLLQPKIWFDILNSYLFDSYLISCFDYFGDLVKSAKEIFSWYFLSFFMNNISSDILIFILKWKQFVSSKIWKGHHESMVIWYEKFTNGKLFLKCFLNNVVVFASPIVFKVCRWIYLIVCNLIRKERWF